MDDLPRLHAHAHVGHRTCTCVAGARYRPADEATIETDRLRNDLARTAALIRGLAATA